jgi:trehalose-phosphatase
MSEKSVPPGQAFWNQVRSSRHPVLGLDYDGTLAPFHVDPLQAHPLPGILEILKKIAMLTPTRIILVSGRPVSELRAMIQIPGTYIGSHGMEVLSHDKTIIREEITTTQAQGIERAITRVREKSNRGRLEDKKTSVALHVRGEDEKTADKLLEQVRNAWSPLADAHDLEMLSFNGGIELRTPGKNKGTALLEYIDSLDPPADLIVYMGDDLTDEDVFTRLPPQGLGIKVGRDNRPTRADAIIEDCQAVRLTLQTWLEITHQAKKQELRA